MCSARWVFPSCEVAIYVVVGADCFGFRFLVYCFPCVFTLGLGLLRICGVLVDRFLVDCVFFVICL